ncbi:MAG TPA: hypothetical protein VIT65_05980 [Microlunatus sp.]
MTHLPGGCGGRRVDCRCPRASHRHGTYEARKRDGCGCEPCLQAGRRYAKRQGHLGRTGRSNLVDARTVRDHVRQLLEAGLTLGQIEQRSGVHRTGLRHLVGTGSDGRPAAARVRRDTAARLLAITAVRVGEETHGLVDPAGTRRRLQALVATGWTQSALARRLGILPANLPKIVRGGRPAIRVATRDAVRGLYDELWDQPPPALTSAERRARTRALKLAAAQGWPPPMAWDDDLIDDPLAQPAGKNWTYPFTPNAVVADDAGLTGLAA